MGRQEEFDARMRETSEEFDVLELEASEAVRLLTTSTRIVVFDVRTRAEYDISHVPGSIHVGKGAERTLGDVIDETLAAHDDATWMMCSAGGYMSAQSIDGLPRQLRHRIFNIRGGVIGYANAAGPLVDAADQPTLRLHGHNHEWAGFVAPPIEAVLPDTKT